jgi:hypothetical protein
MDLRLRVALVSDLAVEKEARRQHHPSRREADHRADHHLADHLLDLQVEQFVVWEEYRQFSSTPGQD